MPERTTLLARGKGTAPFPFPPPARHTLRESRAGGPLPILASWILFFTCAIALAQEDGLDIVRKPVGMLDPAVSESSGIDRQGDLLWTHSDSDCPAELYAVTRTGELVRTLVVPGAENRDWEDIAADGPHLYVGDVGDNARVREFLTIYRVTPGEDGGDPVVWPIRFSYPDAKHDAEAIFRRQGKTWVVTKAREGYTNVYTVPDPESEAPVEAVLAGKLEVEDLVTAADWDEMGGLVVAGYRGIYFFQDRGGAFPFAGKPAHTIRATARQLEAICWDGEDVLFTNEQREVYRIARPVETRVRSFGPELPRAKIPRRPAEPVAFELRDDSTDEVRPDASLSAAWSEKGLEIAGRFPIQSHVPFDPDEAEFGSSLHLLFGLDLSRPLYFTEANVHLFVGWGGDGKARIGQLLRGPEGEELRDVGGEIEIAGSLREGGGDFELLIPFGFLGIPDAAPGLAFLFNCFTLQTGQANMVHWSVGMMEMTHDKPYTWGEWLLGE
ncbi:MAG: hypothetical protein HY720_31980 [Planctomycetes bacterium]|nr:hypothetical protein [Planctomycetota bacterium]